jgi:hypothetical protein
MLKKSLMIILLSLAASVVYAYAPVMVSVTGDMINQSFDIDSDQWGYQFDNTTGKTLTFTLTVANTSQGAVQLQCWHHLNPVENSLIEPGTTSGSCVTDDTIRIVTGDNRDLAASGSYTITVGSQ